MRRLLLILDRVSGRILAIAGWLALPLAALLALQWPLRDAVHAGSRLANDMGQCIFALYAAFALWQATREDAHLTPDALAHRLWSPAALARIRKAGIVLGVVPFSVYVLWSAAPQAWLSTLQLEAFPDSFNPGYFVIKLAMMLLAGAMLVQAVLDLVHEDGS